MKKKIISRQCVFGVVVFFVVNMFLAIPANADPWYVAPGGDDGKDGLSWVNALATIGAGVTKAAGGGTVLVSNGIYNIDTRIDLAGNIKVLGYDANGVAGSGNPADVIVKGTNTMTTGCFYLNHADAMIAGVMITNGMSTDVSYAGGIRVNIGVMSNCVVTGCEAPRGGGVRIDHGMVVATTIEGNTASGTGYGGGGVYFASASTLTGRLIDSHIIGNGAHSVEENASGGGVYSPMSNYDPFNTGWLVSNCFITGNTADVRGAGLRSFGGRIFDSQFISNRLTGTQTDNYAGGGLHCGGFSATEGTMTIVERCHFEANCSGISFGGGGIAVRDGWLILRDSTLTGNFATNGTGCGGGLYANPRPFTDYPIHPTNGVYVENSVIVSNFAKQGGGIYAFRGIIVTNSVISWNEASTGAGGFDTGTGSVSNFVWGCEFVGNKGVIAGGVRVQGTLGAFYNCLITGNESVNAGGVRLAGSGNVLENCTIADNESTDSGGGGIYIDNVAATVRNSIIYGNRANTGDTNWWHHASAVVDYVNNCTMPTDGLPGTANIEADPQFIAAGNYRLRATSPCVNTGTNQNWMDSALDLDGYPRLDRFSGKVDMGCYERVPHGMLFQSW